MQWHKKKKSGSYRFKFPTPLLKQRPLLHYFPFFLLNFTSMLWISTRAGWPSEGRFGSAFIKKPPGPNLAQIWGTENFSGVEGLKGAEMGRKDKIRTGYYVLQLSKLVDVFTQFNNSEVLVENTLSFNLAELCKKINQFLYSPKVPNLKICNNYKTRPQNFKIQLFFSMQGLWLFVSDTFLWSLYKRVNTSSKS